MPTLTITLEDRTEFCSGIIITIAESGYTDSWALIDGYHWQGSNGEHDAPNTRATLIEYGDDSRNESARKRSLRTSLKLTPKVIEDAILVICDVTRELSVHSDYRMKIMTAFVTDEGGDIDAELADIIAQVAVLGDVIYG